MTLKHEVRWLGPTIPVHVFKGPAPGPTAIVEAGIHGDEIAGVHALQALLEDGIKIQRGTLLIIPTMNPPAYRARQRKAPGGMDLNRCFPGDPTAEARELRLAAAFMAMMREVNPALVVTLHESLKRYSPDVTPSFGQTIVYGVEPTPPIVGRVVDAMNATILSDEEHWAPQYYPVATSSTEVIVAALGCVGLCVETWMGFDEARRVSMMREVVGHLLADLGVIDRAADFVPA